MMKYGYIYLFSVLMSLNVLKALWREIGIWKRMCHDCIVPLLGIITHNSLVSLVSPWMPNGTLHDYLEKSKISSAEKYKLVCSFKLPRRLCILLLGVSCIMWRMAYTTVSTREPRVDTI
jgi:serine/threonine protein kinase